MQPEISYNLYIVPIVTLVIGFISFVFLSIYYDVFWITSRYDVPLIYNVSVMFGDFILLPTLNYKIFNLALKKLGQAAMKKYQRKFVLWAIISFIISCLSNVSTHLIWVNDHVTDFIGFRQGEFSLIGYWHLVYSIFQMGLIFMFPFFWFVAIRERNTSAISYSHHIWKYVLLFSTLAVFDMLSKYLFVYHEKGLLYALGVDKFAFLTVVLSVAFFLVMRGLEKREEIEAKNTY